MNVSSRHRCFIVATGVLIALNACGSDTASTPTIAAVAPTIAQITVVPTAASATAAPTEGLALVTPTTEQATSEAPTAALAPTSEGATASGTLTETLDSGLVLYRQPSEGFAIALPPTWQQFNADPKEFQAAMADLTEKNPSFGTLLSQQAQSMVASGIKFMGVDLNADALETGYLTNVNVIKQELPVVVTPEQMLEATAQQLGGIANIVQPITQKLVDLPVGQAGQLEYHLKLATQSGTNAEAAVLQYLIVKDKTLYIVTMGTPVADQATYRPTFEQLAQTFSVLP